MCQLLKKKEEEYGHPIFLITDEPYRELVYDDTEVPYVINYYDNLLYAIHIVRHYLFREKELDT